MAQRGRVPDDNTPRRLDRAKATSNASALGSGSLVQLLGHGPQANPAASEPDRATPNRVSALDGQRVQPRKGRTNLCHCRLPALDGFQLGRQSGTAGCHCFDNRRRRRTQSRTCCL